MHDFRAPPWLPGGHAQTIWPVFFSRRYAGARPVFERERWTTPDGDFVDVDWLGGDADVPLLVLFHGLEGSSTSHYAEAFAADARGRGWRFAIPHFRGCSGELNLAPRAYHSGDWEEVGWLLERFRALHRGRSSPSASRSAATRCCATPRRRARAPRAGASDRRGLGAARSRRRRERDRPRLRPAGLHPDVPALDEAEGVRQAGAAPGPVRRRAAERARDLREFDDVFTAPLHGFRDAADYYARGSAKPRLASIRIPRSCSTRATIRSCPARAAAPGRGRRPSHALAARARRPRRLRRRRWPGSSAACPSRWWGGSTGIASGSPRGDNRRWTRSSPPR
jgi:hypothetical protein